MVRIAHGRLVVRRLPVVELTVVSASELPQSFDGALIVKAVAADAAAVAAAAVVIAVVVGVVDTVAVAAADVETCPFPVPAEVHLERMTAPFSSVSAAVASAGSEGEIVRPDRVGTDCTARTVGLLSKVRFLITHIKRGSRLDRWQA